MTIIWIILVAWVLLSLPVSLLLGAVLKRNG